MDSISPEIKENRKTEHFIHPFILNRWSPRAMTGEPLNDEELMSLFEAARWAPSSRNEQPWRFIYARRDTEYWNTFFDFLVPGNQSWCKKAAVLVVVISKKNLDNDGSFNKTHSFDTGAAWENLALQGAAQGWVVHGMGGFDYDKARKELGVPDDHEVEAMIAIGKRAAKETLPADLQAREAPSLRRPLKETVIEGIFRN